MSKISASAKPLEILVDTFGTQLEAVERTSKFSLLASIALYMATNDPDYPLESCHEEVAGLSGGVDSDLEAMLPQLGTLSEDSLLGLCESLVSQLRYIREA
jgi:hypothetical protein